MTLTEEDIVALAACTKDQAMRLLYDWYGNEYSKHRTGLKDYAFGVQPMTAPTGQVFTLKVRYTSTPQQLYDDAMKVI